MGLRCDQGGDELYWDMSPNTSSNELSKHLQGEQQHDTSNVQANCDMVADIHPTLAARHVRWHAQMICSIAKGGDSILPASSAKHIVICEATAICAGSWPT